MKFSLKPYVFAYDLAANKAYTLVEILAVIGIIGVLSVVAIPNLIKFQSRSRQNEAKVNLRGLLTAEKSFFTEYSTYTNSLQALGWEPEGKTNYVYGFQAQAVVPAKIEGYYGTYANVFNTTDSTYFKIVKLPGFLGSENLPPTGMSQTEVNGHQVQTSCRDQCLGFVAGAAANIDGDDTVDQWQVNQANSLYNAQNDVSQ